MRALNISVTYTVPSAATTTSSGELNSADSAGPLAKLAVPLPAIVVTTHFFSAGGPAGDCVAGYFLQLIPASNNAATNGRKCFFINWTLKLVFLQNLSWISRAAHKRCCLMIFCYTYYHVLLSCRLI